MIRQPTLPLGPEVDRQVRNIELDLLIAEMEPLLAKISTGPWIADTVKHVGENWPIAFFGQDWNLAEHIVSTDRVRASELSGDPESDAKFCALSRRLVPLLIERMREQR